MFESLQDRLGNAFQKFKGQKQLTEDNVKEGLREVRLALLEADVNFKVVKQFVDQVKERALGEEVMKGLEPGQQIIKIVNDELVELLGGEQKDLDINAKPLKLMMVGLQGSGKTTSSGKISLYLRKHHGKKPYLVPADVYRPAAIDQLTTLARQLDVPVYPSTPDMNPVDICKDALIKAEELGCDLILFDTAGRLHIDEGLMDELENIKNACSPQEILFVADAMTGQDAVTVADAFNDKLDITGVVLTKMDGDARGGAALSIKTVTGKSVKFVGVGEKLSELELFHPDRIASRILGMGDMMTLIEKAQTEIDEDEAKAMAEKMAKAEFDFEDFRSHMRKIKKLGSMEGLLKMIPGMGNMMKQMGQDALPEEEMNRTEAIINSMTMKERRQPKLINQSRKERIAKGAGVKVADVNVLIKNFKQMSTVMQTMMGGGKSKKKKGLMNKLSSLAGGGGMPDMSALGGMPGMDGMPGMPGMPGMGEEEGGKRSLSKKTLKARNKKKLNKKKNKKKKKKK
ncbi:Signal Recognition Particle (SRP) component with 4.5S RNA (ffs) [Pseudodesulfovibrio profundus]|uniref:Signal recognition particle protein n=1 Tax=Pseudodesulfovibrio profundus TaxID=57320 RepID=A0A2C8FAI0_9BACT|nr:signal recognition particle protein [Pseudodesulfovibrio profundus]SOB59446.1 Signal Recognition Particle (SRP) component with 4.5S RNA (ffs) [Pseudodesulfovibrio profundus]